MLIDEIDSCTIRCVCGLITVVNYYKDCENKILVNVTLENLYHAIFKLKQKLFNTIILKSGKYVLVFMIVVNKDFK